MMSSTLPGRSRGAAAPDSRLATWLLAVPQLHDGIHDGAVAGTLHDGVAPSYVYPEIAGYWLRWLAFRAVRCGDRDGLAVRAEAAQRWLARWCALPGPPTRVHLDEPRDDWRNGALFCFDLAMVLRGLGSCAAAGLVAPHAPLARTLDALLVRCIAADGAFDALVPLADASRLPARWSTRRGAFLAKAAAGVLRAATQWPVDPRVTAAAERTLADSVAALAAAPHAEAHPLLYACEGVLDLPQHAGFRTALPIVVARHAALLACVTRDGDLPESTAAAAEGPARVDVIAQALRVAHLLALHGVASPDSAAIAGLRTALVQRIGSDGGVPFSRQSPPGQRNTWAAMFADQALAFESPARDGEAWWKHDPLIV